jgi:restriction endonuclease S subunit
MTLLIIYFAVEGRVQVKVLTLLKASRILGVMSKTIKLSQIANIQSGYSFRGKIVDEEGATTGVLQAKDISGLYPDENTLARTRLKFSQSRVVKNGDVLLTSRGSFRAASAKFKGAVIASSSLFTVRIDNPSFLPDYVAIYLNSDPAQYYFQQNARGATIQSLTIDALREIKVPVLPVDAQQTIINLYRNVVDQQAILDRKHKIIADIFKTTVAKTLEGVTR